MALSHAELLERLDPTKIGLKILINELPKFNKGDLYSVDIEHDEFGGFVCCGFFRVGGATAYVVFDPNLLRTITWSDITVIGHNVKTDLTLLKHWGAKINEDQRIYDTQLYAHIIDSSLPEYGLKFLSNKCVALIYPSYEDIVGKRTKKQVNPRVTLDLQPKEIVAAYNAHDVYATAKLYEFQQKFLRPENVTYFEQIERPVSLIFEDMETRGIRVDLPYLKVLQGQLETKLKPLNDALTAQLGPINLNSPKQLLTALQSKGVTPVWRAKPSTDKRALENVKGHSIVSTLLAYREIETLLSSFVMPYLSRNQEFIHPFYNQTGTRTGRLSCSNPNLLQIPKRTENGKLVRKMFIAREGFNLGDCDFGQIEPRVLGHLSKDQNLLRMFNDGVDFHEFTSTNLGINRDRAKVLNLSVGYRATWKSVRQQLKCTQEEAQDEINRWWALFPQLRRWQDKLLFSARKSSYCETVYGRRIKVEGLDSPNSFQREAAERQCINNITQGSAAEIMKLAMINVYKNKRLLSPDFGILVQVYDELLFESSSMEADFEVVKTLMENAVKLDVPIVVDGGIGVNWSEAH